MEIPTPFNPLAGYVNYIVHVYVFKVIPGFLDKWTGLTSLSDQSNVAMFSCKKKKNKKQKNETLIRSQTGNLTCCDHLL